MASKDAERDALRAAFDEMMAKPIDCGFVDEAYALLAAHLRRDRKRARTN